MRDQLVPGASEGTFILKYEIREFLGSGSFGEVWTCRPRARARKRAAPSCGPTPGGMWVWPGSGGHQQQQGAGEEECAVKIIDKGRIWTAGQKGDVLREVGCLHVFQGQHPGLVQLREVLESPREIHLVMELCRGGDLLRLVTEHGRLPERSAKLMLRQIASALAHSHSKGVIHRDIKPENILFDRDAQGLYSPTKALPRVQAKLADFGLSVVVAPGDTTRGCAGSKFYVAPEMLRGKEYDGRADVWSLGVVMCAILTGRLPFTGKTFQDDDGLVRAILRGELDFKQPHWKDISKGAKALLKKMLERDPGKRLTAEELLADPWVAEPAPLHRGLLGLRPSSGARPDSKKSQPTDLPMTLSELDEPERRIFPGLPHSPLGAPKSDGEAHFADTDSSEAEEDHSMASPVSPYSPSACAASPRGETSLAGAGDAEQRCRGRGMANEHMWTPLSPHVSGEGCQDDRPDTPGAETRPHVDLLNLGLRKHLLRPKELDAVKCAGIPWS